MPGQLHSQPAPLSSARAGQRKMACFDATRPRMPLHPSRRRGETVRGLVYGVLAGSLIWALVVLAFVLLR
jgi:hypothetical protein